MLVLGLLQSWRHVAGATRVAPEKMSWSECEL